jgi:hypothetical protein
LFINAFFAHINTPEEEELMKKLLVTAVAALTLGAGVALAATPAAPVMSMTVSTTKVAEGSLYSQNRDRQLAINGSNVYVAYDGVQGPSIIRSTDSGLTWGTPVVLNTTGGSQTRLAVAKDPQSSTKKIIAAAYTTPNGNFLGGDINYQFYVDRPTGAVWSQPVVIGDGYPTSVTMAAAPNGNIHILYISYDMYMNATVYYTMAVSADAPFSTPVALNFSSLYEEINIATDSANNLYVVTPHIPSVGEVSVHKKSYSTGNWTDVSVVPSGASNAASIFALDANNIYIAYKVDDRSVGSLGPHVWIAVSTDGGKTWPTKRVVTPHATQGSAHPSIVVNSSKVISVAATYNAYSPTAQVIINKSSDNGATWSPNAVVAGSHEGSLAVDSAGKTAIVTNVYDVVSTSDLAFANGAASSADGLRPIYFSKEK